MDVVSFHMWEQYSRDGIFVIKKRIFSGQTSEFWRNNLLFISDNTVIKKSANTNNNIKKLKTTCNNGASKPFVISQYLQ